MAPDREGSQALRDHRDRSWPGETRPKPRRNAPTCELARKYHRDRRHKSEQIDPSVPAGQHEPDSAQKKELLKERDEIELAQPELEPKKLAIGAGKLRADRERERPNQSPKTLYRHVVPGNTP